MKPVRIKYYGLFWITRRGYLWATFAAFLFAVVAFVGIWVSADWRPPFTWPPPFRWPWEPVPPDLPRAGVILAYHHYWTIIGVLLLAGVVGFAVVLRKFARKEAEQKPRAAAGLDEDGT